MLTAFRASHTLFKGGIKEVSLMPKPLVLVLWLSKGCSGINICHYTGKSHQILTTCNLGRILTGNLSVKWVLFPPVRQDFLLFVVCIYLKVRHLGSLQDQRGNCIIQKQLSPFTQKQHKSLQLEAQLLDKWNALRQALPSMFKLTPRYPRITSDPFSERWAKLESSSHSGFCSHACTYLVRCFWWHGGWRFGLESILGHESRIMGGHTGQPHGCLLRQIGAAIAIVWTRWVRVRATGPGITTVNAVQTAVRDKRNRERKGERKRHKGGVGRDPYTVQLTFHMSLATGSINQKRKMLTH